MVHQMCLSNGQKVLRVQDPGKHSSCCGANSWVVAKGSRTVFFNGIPAARVGDDTTHCGGKGALVIGSDDVTAVGERHPSGFEYTQQHLTEKCGTCIWAHLRGPGKKSCAVWVQTSPALNPKEGV